MRLAHAILFFFVLVVAASTQTARTHITTGGTLPANCTVGDFWMKTGASAGPYWCSATDTWSALATGGGSGDFSSNTSTSVDSEVVLFSGTGGKTGKRATGTGFAKLTSGVLSAVSSIVESDFGFTNVTTADASITAHGLLKLLDNDNQHCISGQGNWVSCNGGAGSTGADFTNAGNCQGVVTGTGGQTCRDTSNGVLYQKLSAASTNTGWYRVIPTVGPAMSALSFTPFFTAWVPGTGNWGYGGNGQTGATSQSFSESTITGSNVFETDGFYRYGTTTSSGNNVGWFANDFSLTAATWDMDFDIVFHIKTDPSSLASIRYFLALSEGNPTGDDPGVKFIGFRYSTAQSDGGWVGVTRSASASVTSTVSTIATDTVYTLRMRKISGTVSFSVNDGAEQTTSTQVPSGTTKPFFILYVQAVSGTKGLKVQSMSGIRGLIPN